MTAACRWVRWERAARGAHVIKRPLTVTGRLASSTNEFTWTTHKNALAAQAGDGFGFVLGDGVGCYDLDDCLDRGQLAGWAAEAIQGIPEPILFAEVSQSGRGVHIFVAAPEGPGRKIRDGDSKVERYTVGRYIAMTGIPFDLTTAYAQGGPIVEPTGLGARGTTLWKHYRSKDPARNALAVEAARTADRLDELDNVIQGKGVLELMQFRVLDRERDEDGDLNINVEVKFQAVLAEARQQQTTFSQLLGRLDAGRATKAKPAPGDMQPQGKMPHNVTPLHQAMQAAAH